MYQWSERYRKAVPDSRICREENSCTTLVAALKQKNTEAASAKLKEKKRWGEREGAEAAGASQWRERKKKPPPHYLSGSYHKSCLVGLFLKEGG